MEALGTSWHMVAPDQAGFGSTPLPPGSRGGLRLWTEQAAGLMDALGVGSYAVVGHSMGGAVALALAAARPRQVTRVVAVSTMGAPGASLSAELDAVWAAPAGPLGARDMLSRLVLDQTLVTEAAVEARTAAMRAGEAAYASLFPPPRARWADDLTLSAQTLACVGAPVLLVHGAQDRVTPLRSAALPLLEHLADARLHVLGRCGARAASRAPSRVQAPLVVLPPPGVRSGAVLLRRSAHLRSDSDGLRCHPHRQAHSHRNPRGTASFTVVAGAGFEPAKASADGLAVLRTQRGGLRFRRSSRCFLPYSP